MRALSQSNLVEAFAAWGRHEANGRMKDEANFDRNNSYLCADFALTRRSPLASAIFGQDPVQTILVEIEAAESTSVLLYDGRNIDAWLKAADAAKDEGWKHVQDMVSGASPIEGSLIATATNRPAPAPGPIILWEGWHRAAAWRRLFLSGKPRTMSAFLILTAK